MGEIGPAELEMRMAAVAKQASKLRGVLAEEAGRFLYRFILERVPTAIAVELGGGPGRFALWAAHAIRDKGDGMVYSIDHGGAAGSASVKGRALRLLDREGLNRFVMSLEGTAADLAGQWPPGIGIGVLYLGEELDERAVREAVSRWGEHVANGGYIVFARDAGPKELEGSCSYVWEEEVPAEAGGAALSVLRRCMPAEPTLQDRIADLLALEGESFLSELYRQFLGREPDPAGLAYHLNRLRISGSKLDSLLTILMSKEAGIMSMG